LSGRKQEKIYRTKRKYQNYQLFLFTIEQIYYDQTEEKSFRAQRTTVSVEKIIKI